MALSIGITILCFLLSCYSSYVALNSYPDGTLTHCSCQPSLDAHFPVLIQPDFLAEGVVFVKFCKKIFCESRVPRTISRYVAATTRTNHRRRRRPAGRRVRRPSDEASPSGRRLARHSSFFHNQFFDGTGAPPGRQAAGANSRRCSFNCSFSTSMLRYRVASTQSS
jgi:hypothetical protein